MACGLSASGTDSFPAGLRVLAVDDDLGSLKALEKMLLDCSYQVTTCHRAENALSLLRENNTGFDIIMTEIQMPKMSGSQLLAEILKLHMNLPVILFSADLDQDMAKEGIYSGAWHVLSKPISMDILKVIWQLAYSNTKRFDLGRRGSVAPVVPIKGSKEKRDGYLIHSSQEESDQDDSNISVAAIEKKKPRFSWTDEGHNLFVEAVEFLGIDRAVPTKISEYMQRRRKDPYLTRHVISSHLQKFRGNKAAKRGATSTSSDVQGSANIKSLSRLLHADNENFSEAPYSRDPIQHTSSEIPRMRYTVTPSPCSMQMPTTPNIPPTDSSSQSTYLDQDAMYRECFQMNDYEPKPNQNLDFPQGSYALQQNTVGFGYTRSTVPHPNQHLSFQDLVYQDIGYAGYKPLLINEDAMENMRLGSDYSFLEELLLE